MSYQTQYVDLPDDKVPHIIGDDQETRCGIDLPYNSAWTTDEPDKVCPKCRKALKDADEA